MQWIGGKKRQRGSMDNNNFSEMQQYGSGNQAGVSPVTHNPLVVGHHPQMQAQQTAQPNPNNFEHPPRESYKTEADDDNYAVPVRVNVARPQFTTPPKPPVEYQKPIPVVEHVEHKEPEPEPVPMSHMRPWSPTVHETKQNDDNDKPHQQTQGHPYGYGEYQTRETKASKWPMLIVLILVAGFGTYLLLDAGIISNNLNLPFHIFK